MVLLLLRCLAEFYYSFYYSFHFSLSRLKNIMRSIITSLRITGYADGSIYNTSRYIICFLRENYSSFHQMFLLTLATCIFRSRISTRNKVSFSTKPFIGCSYKSSFFWSTKTKSIWISTVSSELTWMILLHLWHSYRVIESVLTITVVQTS